ncbi:MAG: tetratricopeptide repeat protein [Anaerolineae bacterium]
MPEISLKDYLAKLDSALFAGSADEVIHHCRHILQFYPKNVAAYRYLGRALVYNARYDEGSAALRRVLSVIPDDYMAHLSLSEAYDGLKRGDPAIWHLERAFEQQPNNRELIEGVRSLYRRYRSIEPKVQLTGAAVARQHLANGRTTQAIETLRGSVARTPDRVDLKLLLAQTLWRHGDEVGGAETALDVLELLPDCLEANVLMTDLWLRENRPSDAQRYLNRVESIDPYRALEIAQGDAPDDAFRLEELDYQRFAKTEAVSARPDWLKAVSGDSPAATSNDDVNAEWQRWQSGMLASPEAAPAAPPSTSTSSDFDFNFDDLAAPAETPASTLSTPASDDDSDPMQWMRAAGVEVYEAEQEVPLFDDDFDVNIEAQSPTAWMEESNEVVTPERAVPVSDDDPMAWLRAENPHLIDESVPPSPVLPSEAEEPDFDFGFDFGAAGEPISASAPDESEDASPSSVPDWLAASAPDSEPIDLFADDEPIAQIDAAPDWLQSSAPQAQSDDQGVPDFDLFGDPVSSTQGSTLSDESGFSFGSSFDAPAESPAAAEPAAAEPPSSVPGARKGLTAMLNDANLDWLSKPQQEQEAADESWMSMFSEPKATPSVSDTPAWLSALDSSPNAAELSTTPETDDSDPFGSAFASDPLVSDPFASDPVSSAAGGMDFEMPTDADFDWLPADSGEEDDQAEKPVEDTTEVGTLLNGYTTSAPTAPAPAGDTPDWLYEMRSESLEPEAERTPMESSSPQEGEDHADELPDWLFEMNPEPSAETEPQPSEESQPEADSEFSFDSAEVGGFDWSAVEAKPEAEPESNALPAALPNWLDGLTSGFASEPEPEAVSEPEPETPPEAAPTIELDATLHEILGTMGDEPEVETAASDSALMSEIPDWLMELQPEGDSEPAAESAAEPEALPEPTPEPETAPAMPDPFSFFEEDAQAEPELEEDAFAALFADPHVPDSSVELTESMLPVGLGAVEHESPPLGEDTITADALPAEEDLSWLTEAGDTVGHEADQGQDFGVLEGEPDEVFATNSEWVTDDLAAAVGDQSSVVPQEAPLQADLPDWLSELQPAELPPKETPELPPAEPMPEAFSFFEDDAQPEVPAESQPELEEDALAALFADPHVPDSSVELTESMLPVGLGAVEHEPPPLGEDSITADVVPAEDDFSWLTEAGEAVGHETDQGQDLGVLEGEPDEVFATNSEWVTDDLAAAVGDQSSIVDFLDAEEPAAVSETEDSTPVAEPVSELPEWLIDMQPETADTPESAAEVPVTEEVSVLEESSAPEELAAGLEASSFDESTLEVQSAVEAVQSDDDEFDWLSEAGDVLEPAIEEPYTPEVTMATEPTRPEELAHGATENVPDWLNAIIPGIDIDVEEGDVPVESDFVEEPGVLEHETPYAAENDADFDWLVDIVDEETRETLPEAPPELPETPGVKPSAGAQPRFAFTRRPDWLKFSKAPAWLKNNAPATPSTASQPPAPTGNASTPATPAAQDDFPDWPEDDPDDMNELPDWLK